MSTLARAALVATVAVCAASRAGADPLDRTSLPIREPPAPTITTLDVRDATPPPRFEVRAPEGAPNVLVVVLDDVGFGQTSTFGGAVETPTLDRLAAEGLRYTQFHTTALCSPTRTALQTGRNHHSNDMGAITEMATAFPGDTSVRPQDITPLAEILRLNGYATAAFGKSHETPSWEITATGPFDRWPTGSGFERFYGFLGGETSQWSPLLYDGTRLIERSGDRSVHLSTDLADHAIAWLREEHTLRPDQPFYLYFATGAAHAPHQVPREWIDRYAGRFDEGWDVYRERTLARQKALGLVPRGTKLADKPEAIADWKDLGAEERRLFARQMEVFAGFLSHADHEVGRVVDALADLGVLDHTLVVYLAGDNGASAEGGPSGVFDEHAYFNRVEEPLAAQLDHLDELGGPMTYNHYAAGWAVAGDAPFTWTKQVASSYGGTRNGLVIRPPTDVAFDRGGIRTQWHHVIDVAPTVLEVAGLPEPTTVDGLPQRPMEGVSMAYTFADADAPSTHTTQYFEMFGNRAIYHDGWLAGTVHAPPWAPPATTFEGDTWELYDTRQDFSLAHDLARRHPEKLEELKALFLEEAVKHHVLPLDDRGQLRFDPVAVGRPAPMAGRDTIVLEGGMVGFVENAFPQVKNRSVSIAAIVHVDEPGDGAIVAQGGRFGGWSLYLDEGRPTFTYNWVGLERYHVAAAAPLTPGPHVVRWAFDYDGGGRGKGGTGRLSVDGALVAEGRIERTNGYAFGVDETADVGTDLGTPVTEAYVAHPAFPGRVEQVTFELGPVEAEPVTMDLPDGRRWPERR